ncbi:MAG TPA: hypothetical protein VF796_13680, partial [Humisphaera sp.]
VAGIVRAQPAPATAPATAPADPKLAPPEPVELTVRPKALGRPALAHRLTVPAVEQTPGDAAPLYYTAALMMRSNDHDADPPLTADERKLLGAEDADKYQTALDVFTEMPIDKLPVKAAADYVGRHRDKIELLDLAATRARCDWGSPLREQGFRTLLPALSSMRQLARIVVAKARWQVATGDPAGAVRTLRANVALARHLGTGDPILVNALVGVGTAQLTVNALHDVARHPDAPNLYAALAELPRPLVDLSAAFEQERVGIYATFPELRKGRDGTITPEDVNRMFRRLQEFQGMMSDQKRPAPAELGRAAGAVAMTALLVPAARQYLTDNGTPADRVAALEPAVAVGRFLAMSLDEVYDDAVVAGRLPYYQAVPLIDRQAATVYRWRVGTASVPHPFAVIVPALGRVHVNRARLDRAVAMLMVAEALRAHAAANGGAVPARLEDVTVVPVPSDPVTGKAFAYRADGRTATLESPPPPGDPARSGAVLRVTVGR